MAYATFKINIISTRAETSVNCNSMYNELSKIVYFYWNWINDFSVTDIALKN